MNKMNIPLMATLLALSIIVCPVLYFTVGPALDDSQLEVLKILGIIAGCSAIGCTALSPFATFVTRWKQRHCF